MSMQACGRVSHKDSTRISDLRISDFSIPCFNFVKVFIEKVLASFHLSVHQIFCILQISFEIFKLSKNSMFKFLEYYRYDINYG